MSPPFPTDFRPRLRPTIRAATAGRRGEFILHDTSRLSPATLGLTRPGVRLAEMCDGTRTLADLRTAVGPSVSADQIAAFVAGLDEALLLDAPGFAAYLAGPVRRPSCVGSYPPDPAGIRDLLDGLFTGPGGPGRPAAGPVAGGGRLRAVLAPHMDYGRGGVTYGWAYKELAERTDARLFVVVATSHYSPERFTLTRKNFETPLGTAVTDQAFLDRLVGHYGDGLFADRFAHLPEHSVELEVVLLQHLLADRGPIRIVPLLVGSFADCVAGGTSPGAAADIRRMAAALRAAEAAAGEPVCYVISGDLAHIGPKFRDPGPVTAAQLAAGQAGDDELLNRLAAADHDGYFDAIAAEGDRRRICGLPPTWLTLEALRPTRGKVLHYGRYVHPEGHESVSFAAAAFYD